MKRTMLLLIVSFLVVVIGVSSVPASERYPLGRSNFTLKLDYFQLTNSALKGSNLDSGSYFGIEGYRSISPGLYLGGEFGWAYTDARYVNTYWQLGFYPLELNLKYAVKASRNFVIAFGGGASLNYAEARAGIWPYGGYVSDWLFGGQVFLDLNYVSQGWFIGVNGKYQVTSDFKGRDFDFDNWRVGIHIGGNY